MIIQVALFIYSITDYIYDDSSVNKYFKLLIAFLTGIQLTLIFYRNIIFMKSIPFNFYRSILNYIDPNIITNLQSDFDDIQNKINIINGIFKKRFKNIITCTNEDPNKKYNGYFIDIEFFYGCLTRELLIYNDDIPITQNETTEYMKYKYKISQDIKEKLKNNCNKFFIKCNYLEEINILKEYLLSNYNTNTSSSSDYLIDLNLKNNFAFNQVGYKNTELSTKKKLIGLILCIENIFHNISLPSEGFNLYSFNIYKENNIQTLNIFIYICKGIFFLTYFKGEYNDIYKALVFKNNVVFLNKKEIFQIQNGHLFSDIELCKLMPMSDNYKIYYYFGDINEKNNKLIRKLEFTEDDIFSLKIYKELRNIGLLGL